MVWILQLVQTSFKISFSTLAFNNGSLLSFLFGKNMNDTFEFVNMLCIMYCNNGCIFSCLEPFLTVSPLWMCFPRSQKALKTGHFVSVLQVLMQLQRVCNHPELVAPRETSSSFFCSSLQYNVPSLVLGALQRDSSKVHPFSLSFLMCTQICTEKCSNHFSMRNRVLLKIPWDRR